MNKLKLWSVAFEVTRRCNIKCDGFCMRGEAQNIDMGEHIIDTFLDTESKGYIIESIDHICFTGGEPTLNPRLIIYIINKIIEENIPVKTISMATNGQLFVPELVEAFNKFNKYRNLQKLKKLRSDEEVSLQELIEYSTNNNNAGIVFSTDRFHAPIQDKIREMYNKAAKGVTVRDYVVKEEKIVRTGLATFGKDFESEECLYYDSGVDARTILENVYVTAKGDVAFGGDGSYEYIDGNIIGKVDDVSIFDAISICGEDISKCKIKTK